MASAKNIKKVCVESLQAELSKGPITNAKRGWQIMTRYLGCFIAVARQVDNLTLELFGNGTPGGIKQEVAEIRVQLDSMEANIKLLMENLSANATYGKRKDDMPERLDRDTFAQFVRWFADKVLPALLVAFILGLANLLVFLLIFRQGMSQ